MGWSVSGSNGAQLVRNGVYQPPGRREKKRRQLKLAWMPWMLALYLFTPQYKLGKPDHVIERAHRWRTMLAVVLAVSTTVPYIGSNAKTEDVLSAPLGDLFITGMFLIPLFLIAVAILVFFSPPRWRADTFRELRRPLASMGAFTLIYVIFGTMMGLGFADFDKLHISKDIDPFLHIVVFLVLLWYIPLLICSAFFAARHLFNAIDGNLLLPPLFVTIVAWWSIIQRLIFQNPYKPLWLDLLLGLGGALVMTALSGWEVVRLARRGITLGSGPYPPVPPPPAPYPPAPYGGYPPQPSPYPPPYR
jgi:hypothetical protein